MLFTRYRSAFEHLRAVLKPAIAFEIWFTLIFLVFFAPASGWLMNRLVASSGQYAVSDHDLISFLLSSRGILFLLFNVGFVLAFWFAEQVGLLIIVVNATSGRKDSVSVALWGQITRLLALLRLGLIQAVIYIAAGIPFGLGIGITYWLLLREWDLYFYVNVKPLSWWIALAIAGTMFTAYLLVAAWLYIRWLFSIPALVFENTTPTGALKKSWQQTRGRFLEFGFPLAGCWVVVFVSSFAMTWLIRAVAGQLLVDTGLTLKVVVPTVVGTLALVAIVDIMWLIIGKTAHVILMAGFYLETTAVEQRLREPAPPIGRISPTGLKRIGWIIAGILLIMGISAGVASS